MTEMKHNVKAEKLKTELEEKTERFKQSAAENKEQWKHSAEEMSAELKELLAKELETLKTRDKHRYAEMLAIFAKHNFYANGFTPLELRTTLEDLGPTYVKMGQIMSSRSDLLPASYCHELENLSRPGPCRATGGRRPRRRRRNGGPASRGWRFYAPGRS